MKLPLESISLLLGSKTDVTLNLENPSAQRELHFTLAATTVVCLELQEKEELGISLALTAMLISKKRRIAL